VFLPPTRKYLNENVDKYGGIWVGNEKNEYKDDDNKTGEIKNENKAKSYHKLKKGKVTTGSQAMPENFQLQGKANKSKKEDEMVERTISQSDLNKIEVLSIRRLPHHSLKLESGVNLFQCCINKIC